MAASGTPTSGFIGRERELAELGAGMADVTAGHGHLFLPRKVLSEIKLLPF
jgi:hypothetical protein